MNTSLKLFLASIAISLTLFHPLPAQTPGFIHPGIYHNAADLAFIREKLDSGAQPWTDAMAPLVKAANLKTPINAQEVFNADFDDYMGGDSQRAYALALHWALTGDQTYADRAIEILNTWASTLKSITSSNKPSQHMLACSWNGHFLANAAELLKHHTPKGSQPSGWKEEDVAKFRQNVLQPMIEVMRPFKPNFNGNWNASIMTSMASIAVFNDDWALFNHTLDQFWGRYELTEKGNNVGHLEAYVYPTGQCQESDRDYGHVQMGLSFYASLCEIAWKQGIDLYSAYDNRLLVGFEHMSKYMLGEDVPFEKFSTTRTDAISPKFRGIFSNAYETAHQHYVYRKGLQMPYTSKVIHQESIRLVYSKSNLRPYRPEGSVACVGIPWGTLTMYKGEEDPQAARK